MPNPPRSHSVRPSGGLWTTGWAGCKIGAVLRGFELSLDLFASRVPRFGLMAGGIVGALLGLVAGLILVFVVAGDAGLSLAGSELISFMFVAIAAGGLGCGALGLALGGICAAVITLAKPRLSPSTATTDRERPEPATRAQARGDEGDSQPVGRGQPDTCPHCGTPGQAVGRACENCARTIIALPKWAQAATGRRGLPSWRRMVLAAVSVVGLLALAWVYYPFMPNPVTLAFKRPGSDLTSEPPVGAWTMGGGDLRQSNFVPYSGELPRGRAAAPIDLGESTRSSPAVVDGVVYAGAHLKVVAIDEGTRRPLWEHPVSGPVHSSPAVAGGLLYVGLLDDRILALDRLTGRLAWSYEARDPVPGSAAVDRGIVYIGSRDGSLYALDAATGKVIWKLNPRGLPASPPAVYDGRVFVTSSEGDLYARDSRTGDKRLQIRTGKLAIRSPAAGNGLVYFEAGGDVLAVDATARGLPVQYQLSLVWAQLSTWGFPVSDPPGQPGVRWRVSPDDPTDGFLFAPVVTPEAIYLGDTAGLVYAFDALSGDRLWSFRTRDRVTTRPLAVGPRLYFGTVDGGFYSLDRSTGEQRWRMSLDAPLAAPPVFAGGRLYLRTEDGLLHPVD